MNEIIINQCNNSECEPEVKDEIIVRVTPQYDLQEMLKMCRKLARCTANKEDLNSEVSEEFVSTILASQHSPVREVRFLVECENISVSTQQQFSRHHILINGHWTQEYIDSTDVEHYAASQRPDRNNGKPRGGGQNYSFSINAQGLIEMSKKRLCAGAEYEARKVWGMVKAGVAEYIPQLADMMQPTCVWQVGCTEMFSKCQWINTPRYEIERCNLTRNWRL